ncbi:restriction endonuclease subunit S [Rhizobium leguminosarum bv. trifolii]|uniref:restriction endonuclease subunit S n=1 Tax=Rhizobium leguminosarum TaxID=384 RepID=UPI00140FB580|nr:restriction endonuclease subunit S [Rhizobium leguminosarum]QIO52953.1 restriction endonuclease subunit S [Rhizobium leguminosarum bv. trifolii]
MASIDTLLTDHLDLWTSAIARKSSAGRGRSGKFSLYGIEKLRALILDLAVRGKLVPQDPADEHASAALERAEASDISGLKRGGAIARKKIGSGKADIAPSGWVLATISQIASVQAGFAFKSNDFNEVGSGLPLIRIRDVGQTFTGTYYSGEYRDEFIVRDGDYLISMDGEFRISKWTGPRALLNQRVARLIFKNEEIEKRFVAIALQKQLSKLQGVKAYTTVDHLSGKQIAETQIGFPPIAEQRRIVAKVDELMALCERLEAGTYEEFEAHQLLVTELLTTLTASRDADELADNWARIEAHFHDLFITEGSVDQLRQTILQLAVMGRLSRQLNSDDKSNQRHQRPDDQAEEYDLKSFQARAGLFPLPEEWLILPLSRVCTNIVDCPHTTPRWTAEGWICVKSDQVKPGLLDLTSPNYVSEETFFERIERLEPQENDILYKREGGILGVAARIPPNTRLCLGQRLMLVRATSATLPEFLELVLNSKWITEFAQAKTTGGAAPRVNMAIVRAFPIPVPPLSEQVRIINKVGELMALCDAYSSMAKEAANLKIQIADAIATKAAG